MNRRKFLKILGIGSLLVPVAPKLLKAEEKNENNGDLLPDIEKSYPVGGMGDRYRINYSCFEEYFSHYERQGSIDGTNWETIKIYIYDYKISNENYPYVRTLVKFKDGSSVIVEYIENF